MPQEINRDFAKHITNVIAGKNLDRKNSYNAFSTILKNETTDMQQGALLAALTAKGETKEEIAGCWEAIYDHDTVKVTPKINKPIVENSGTGMDTYKTFNISTIASLIAVTGGITMARHGARAITSVCGTVDIAEALGVDVECDVSIIAKSLETCNLALFNGMSSKVHPNALGRILSQIYFGSTLNIAASLASPIKPDIGIRGVYTKEMIRPVIEVMKEIGYSKAFVMYGSIDNSTLGMDEASISGITYCAEFNENSDIIEYTIRPEDIGLKTQSPQNLSPCEDIYEECRNVYALLSGKGSKPRTDSVALNAGIIFSITGKTQSIKEGIEMAFEIIKSQKAINSLENWVQAQNQDPEEGIKKLHSFKGE